jgi:DNA-binding transcriptional MerR regulator
MKIEKQQANSELATIDAFSREFGLTPRALRFYEEKGLLNPLRLGGVRFYDDVQRRRAQMIVKAKLLGFTLAEISERIELSESSPDNAELQLDTATAQAQLEFLEAQRSAMDQAIAELRASIRLAALRDGSK